MDRPALDRWTLLGEKRNDLLTLHWSALTMYDINAPGHKAGVLIGTTGWSPR